MINRILMELYDDYSKNNIEPLVEFSKKTFSNEKISNLFIGCVLILFDNSYGFKPRYNCTRENLLGIVLSTKEKIKDTNLLKIYMNKINKRKGINKYLKNILDDENMDKYANIIIDYLEQFKPNFINNLKNKLDNN